MNARFKLFVLFLLLSETLRVHGQLAAQNAGDDAKAETAAAALIDARILEASVYKPIVVTIGDSITAFGSNVGGWVARMAGAYGASAEILNKGVPMGSTRSGLSIIAALTNKLFPGDESRRVKLAIICYGANDASTSNRHILDRDPWRLVPVEEYEANLVAAIRALRQARIRSILLITPPAPAAKRVDRALEVTAQYAETVKHLGHKLNVPVADLFSAMLATPNWDTEMIVEDGLHLTAKGNEVMYNEVMRAINTTLPAVSPESLWRKMQLLWSGQGELSDD